MLPSILDSRRWVFVCAVLSAYLAACAPPPLTNQPAPDTDDDGTTPDVGDVGDTAGPDAGETGAMDAGPPPEFPQIAAIIRYRCTTPEGGCHSGQGQQGFAIQGGPIATEQQIRDALEQQMVAGEQTLLVDPGSPTDSAIYQVLIPLNNRPRMPFQRDKLPADEIHMIERWIAAGANYE